MAVPGEPWSVQQYLRSQLQLTGLPAADTIRFSGFWPRVAHKVLVLINNNTGYLVAVVWLRAVFMLIGGFQFISFDVDLTKRQIILVWLWSALLLLTVLNIVRWLTQQKVLSESRAHAHSSTLSRLWYLIFATCADFAASAGAYAVMNSVAYALIATIHVPTLLGIWLVLGLLTFVSAFVLVLGDKGRGPLSVLYHIEDDGQRGALRFQLVFNTGFVLAFAWYAAADTTLRKLAPVAFGQLWARWALCIAVIAASRLLITVYATHKVTRKQAAAQAAAADLLESASVPLLEGAPPSVKSAIDLSGDLLMHAATLVGAIAFNFTIAAVIGVSYSWQLETAWFVYASLVSIFFVTLAAALEQAMLRRALLLCAAAGVAPAPLVEEHTPDRQEGTQRLAWYQQRVIRPMVDAAAAHLTATAAQRAMEYKAVQQYQVLEKEVESLLTAVAYMAAFAWTNWFSWVYLHAAPEMAPPADHYWVFAVVVTALVVAVDVVVVRLHHRLSERFGV